MSSNMVLLLMFGSLTLFMLSGLPIAFVLGGLSLLGCAARGEAPLQLLAILVGVTGKTGEVKGLGGGGQQQECQDQPAAHLLRSFPSFRASCASLEQFLRPFVAIPSFRSYTRSWRMHAGLCPWVAPS